MTNSQKNETQINSLKQTLAEKVALMDKTKAVKPAARNAETKKENTMTKEKPALKLVKPSDKPAPKAAAPAKSPGVKGIHARLESPGPVKSAPQTPAPASTPSNVITVSQIAAELGKSPKAVRAKLRRVFGKAQDGRWGKIERNSPRHAEILKALSDKEPTEK